MPTKLGLSAIVALALAVFAVGCGGSSNNSGNSTPSSTPATTPSTTPAADTTSTSSGGSGGGAASASPQVQAAVTACKNSVDSNPQVPASVKGDLEGICEKAASGDPAAVRKATKEVCLKIVEATVPDSAKDQAKAACNSVGG